MVISGTLDGPRRPREPTSIFCHDIEKNVGVDQYRRHSVIAGQRHDRVRAHRDIAAPSQMSDKPGAATIALTGFGTNDAHDLTIEFELHFGLWQQTRLLADFGRNGHLTFGCDTHCQILTLTCKSKEVASICKVRPLSTGGQNEHGAWTIAAGMSAKLAAAGGHGAPVA